MKFVGVLLIISQSSSPPFLKIVKYFPICCPGSLQVSTKGGDTDICLAHKCATKQQQARWWLPHFVEPVAAQTRNVKMLLVEKLTDVGPSRLMRKVDDHSSRDFFHCKMMTMMMTVTHQQQTLHKAVNQFICHKQNKRQMIKTNLIYNRHDSQAQMGIFFQGWD